MPWASLMWQQWTEGLLGISPPLGCCESRDLAAAAQLWKICSWTAKTQNDKLQTNPNTWPFRKFSSQLELCSSFYIILSVVFLLRKTSLWWPCSPLAKKEIKSCFLTFCLCTDKKNSATISTVITQKSIKHSTRCEEVYTSPSLFLLGICGSMVNYFKWNRSISVLVFFSCLEARSLVQM